jgi:hypothetical protein
VARTLGVRFREQARGCRSYGSPLTAALLEGAIDDYDAGGVVADLMGPHAHDPAGSVPPLRFAAALHRLVLTERAPELAAHYPSAGGTADPEQLWPAARETVATHLEELRSLVRLPVQTNEVGRAAVLFGVLRLVGGRIRLLELGASGGLNLRCDRFAYEVGEEVLGAPDSPVRLVQPWEGSFPPYAGFEVVERLGCDPNPVDVTTEEGRLTLRSCVWGDQVHRLARLDAALEVAAGVPARVEALGALDFLHRELVPRPDVTTVVWHSVVMQYVDPAEREDVERLLERVGSHARGQVVRASMEPEPTGKGDEYVFRVRLQRWPDGERVHVADANGHGPPVRWVG